MPGIPIIVVSFNRPHYLAQVLDSLSAQTALDARPIFLFQDNAVSPYTDRRFASDADVAACVETFRQRFPSGTAFVAEHNLGIARNFLRAEEFVFNELNSDVGYFFEDDMVLSPHYLTMMDQMYGYARNTDRIGYFAAYGALAMPLKNQRAHANEVKRFAYNWAFGLRRHHWTELRNWLEPYYEFSRGRDYKQRRTDQIARYYRDKGVPLISADQDVMKQMGTYVLGRVSISTIACFAKYIGVEGVHFKPGRFEKAGLDKTEIYPQPVKLNFPTAEQLERLYADQKRIRWERFHAHMEKHKPKEASSE